MKKKGYFLALLIILLPLSYWAGSVGNDAESQTGSEDALLSVNLAQEQEIASLEQEISSLNDNISQQEAQISSHVEEIDILNSTKLSIKSTALRQAFKYKQKMIENKIPSSESRRRIMRPELCLWLEQRLSMRLRSLGVFPPQVETDRPKVW